MPDEIKELIQLLDTSIALALMVWLYSGLRDRHWKKTDEMDAKLWELVDERAELREQIAHHNANGETQPIKVPTRQDARD